MEELLLLHKKKIAEILGGQVDSRLEASGVLAKDGFFYVIFDNLAKSKQGKWCRDKDQSIHIFEIPPYS